MTKRRTGDPLPEYTRENVVAFIRRRKAVSFAEIERRFGIGGAAGPDRMEWAIGPRRNVVLWLGWRAAEFRVLVDLCADDTLKMSQTSLYIYLADGACLSYPIVKRPPAKGYKRPRWLPIVFDCVSP